MLVRAAILLLVTLGALLPAWFAPEWQGTEGRRVQIALEMVRSGDWIVPTIGGQPTWAKPPLHYWLLGACAKLFGAEQWAMRLPAVLFLFAAALVAMETLRKWFGKRAGWVGALGMVLSPLALFEWPTAEIDPTFASLTAMSLWLLATGVARDRRGFVFASGVVAGLAMLQKGVPYFMFAAGAYLVWWRYRGGRHGLLHFVPMLVIAAAYYVPVWVLKIGFTEWFAVAKEESVGRLKFFEWQHLAGIPEYWARAILVQAPFGLWCFWEWRGARDARMDAGDVTLRMCSGAAVVGVAVLTFFPGRATRYLMPNVLLFGFAVAPAVAHFSRQVGAIGPLARRIVVGAGIGGALALCVIPFVPKAVPALPIAAVVAVAPFLVRRPVHFVAYCLLVPLVSAAVVGFDGGVWQRASRARHAAGELLRSELERRGAIATLATHGHVDAGLLLEAGLLPPGDESARSKPTAPWVLCEAVPPPAFAGYVERLRLCLPQSKTFVLFERSDSPR
ncbi:MAG: glycosyltransferase family 39 protein [Planctomycetes bacterium]|nr:glycosyltransferase family 39 protein [Planctomycetota bacterium]